MNGPYCNQSQSQGPHGANLNPDHDPRMGTSNMGLPFSPSGASTPASPLHSLPMFSQQMPYRPEAERNRTTDLQLSRTRDETRHLNAPLSQGPSQMTPQRDDLYSPSTSRPPPRASDGDSSIDGSLSWLRDIPRSTTAKSQSSLFPSSSSSFPGGCDSQFERIKVTIPGLGDYPETATPHQRDDPPPTKYGAETATSILRHFNLEKEDLEQLLTLPEDEITPEKLPLILRQMQLKKSSKAAAASTSSYKDPSPARPTSDSSSWADCRQSKAVDSGQKDLPGRAIDYAKDISLPKQSTTVRDSAKDVPPSPPIPSKTDSEREKSPVVPSKVTDYGHTSISRAIQGILNVKAKESVPPAETDTTKPIPSSESSCQDKSSVVSCSSPPLTSTFPSATSESIEKPSTAQGSSPQKRDVDRKQPQSKQATKKTGVILLDRIKNQNWPVARQTNPQHPAIVAHRALQFDRACAPMATSMPMNLIPSMFTNAMAHPTASIPGPLQMSGAGNFAPLMPALSLQCQPKIQTFKRTPSVDMLQDYAAATPRSFPHTCTLCRKECSEMKDWLSHQNHSIHITNCALMRRWYPYWDGKVAERDLTRSLSRSPSPWRHHNRHRDRRRSRSPSPQRRRRRSRSASPSSRWPRSRSRSRERRESSPRRAEWRRRDDKRTYPKRKDERRQPDFTRSPSRSPSPRRLHDSKHRDRSSSRSPSPERRRKSQAEDRRSPRRKDERRASPKRRAEKRTRSSPRRSQESSTPPRHSPSRCTPPRGRDRERGERGESEEQRSLSRSSRETRSPSKERRLKRPTEKMLEKSSVLKSFSDSVDVESLVETMMPLLMSRLTKEMAATADPSTAPKKKEAKDKNNKKPRKEEDTIAKNKEVASTTHRKSPDSTVKNPAAKTKARTAASETAPRKSASKSATPEPVEESCPNVEPFGASLTVGETLDKRLTLRTFKYQIIDQKFVFERQFLEGDRTLVLLTDLPSYSTHPYSEEDIVKRLKPFRFQDKEPNKLYILPQCRMAFAELRQTYMTQQLVVDYVTRPDEYAMFGACAVTPHVLSSSVFRSMTPYCFYVSLMQLCKYECEDNGERIIFITNISDSDEAELRKRLKKIGSVKNYVPLLNKVFVEFTTIRDADRLGVYHSLLNTTPTYEINRMRAPERKGSTWPPLWPARAMPDASEIVPGVVVPAATSGIPVCSGSSFWVTLTSKPFLFPTHSPWFIIPGFETAKLREPSCDEPQHTAVMLTGLPQEGYTQLQVVGLTLPFGHDHCMHHRVIVLPLQRRAFINFLTAAACAQFVNRSLRAQLEMESARLNVHYVSTKLFPVSTEEEVYSTFMKLSNNRAPVGHLLEQRLLCVSVAEVSLELIRLVMEVVTSAAPILGFLPLADRILIEVPNASNVEKVKEKFSSYKPEITWKERLWSKVLSVEISADFKKRLGSPGNTVEANATRTKDEGTASDEKPEQPRSGDSTEPAAAELEPEEQETKEADQKQISGDAATQHVSSGGIPFGDLSNAATFDEIVEEGDTVTPEPTGEKSESGSKLDPTKTIPVPESPGPSVEAARPSLTVGETLDKLLTPDALKGHTLSHKSVIVPRLQATERDSVVLCDLPEFDPQSPFTEEELVRKLTPFGFRNERNGIYVIPQCKMAFCKMPNGESARALVAAFLKDPRSHAMFRGSKLTPRVFSERIEMEPWSFYCRLMQICKHECDDDSGQRTVFISNIASDVAEFRKGLERFGPITNFLPLLNEAFVEFETNVDADRLGVHYSLLNKTPSHKVTRMISPAPKPESQLPSQVSRAMPEDSELAPGVTVPQASCQIPPLSQSSFWVTLTSNPFLFPTECPWFNIPDFETLRMKRDGGEDVHKQTVMLTNLPKRGYTHEEVAKLVWQYFLDRDLRCYYYDVIVLPLQRRAFINLYPEKSEAFVKDLLNERLQMRNIVIPAFYISSKLFPLSSEEEMYETFMALSNNRAPQKQRLDQRLLCVFMKKFSPEFVSLVMEVVTSAAPVLGFLPLANRICIEMPEVSDVAKVKEKFLSFKPESDEQEQLWKRVLSLETSAELKERVKKSGNRPVSLKIPFDLATSKWKDFHIYMGRDDPKDSQRDREKSTSFFDRYHRPSSPFSRKSIKHSSLASSSCRPQDQQEKGAKSSFVEPMEEDIQDLKDDYKTTEKLSGEGKVISESCQVLDPVEEAAILEEERVPLGEDSVAETQNMEDSINKEMIEEPNLEKEASQSESVTENTTSLNLEIGSKRKREEDDAESQAVSSKTSETNDEEHGEQETFESLDSTEDQMEKVEDVPNVEQLVEKDEEEETSPKRQEWTIGKPGTMAKEESTISAIEEEIVESKVGDSEENEPTKADISTGRGITLEKREERVEILVSAEDDSKNGTCKSYERSEGEEAAKEESSTNLEPGTCETSDSVEEKSASISEKSRTEKMSASDSLTNESMPSQSRESPAREPQKAKAKDNEEGDLVEVQTRSTRSSQRNQTADSPRKGSTPTRQGRAPARGQKPEKLATKIDVPKVIEQKFEIQDAVAKDPTPLLKAKRCSPRKQPDEKLIQQSVSVGMRSTRSGKVRLSEELSPKKQRTSKRKEAEQESKSELPTDKDEERLNSERSAINKLVKVSISEAVEDKESKEKEQPPQVAVKRKGRPRKRPRKSASKSGDIKADIQSIEEGPKAKIEQDKMDDVSEKQEMEKSDIALEEDSKNKADNPVEKDKVQGEECGGVSNEAKDTSEDLTRENDQTTELNKQETAEREDGEEAKENVDIQEQNLEAPTAIFNKVLEEDTTGNTEVAKQLEDQTTSKDIAENVQFVEKDDIQVIDSTDKNMDSPRNTEELIAEGSPKRQTSKTCELESNQECKTNVNDFSIDARHKKYENEQELGDDSADIQHLVQGKAEKDEGKMEKVNKVSVEKMLPPTEENETIDEAVEELKTKAVKPKKESVPELDPTQIEILEVEEEETPKSLCRRGKRGRRKKPVRKSIRGGKAGQNIEELEEGQKKPSEVGSKRKTEVEGPDSKRHCSQLPSPLPPFRPNNPLGQEYVVPKFGFFCDLCRMFYLNESTAREEHCSSRRHYDSLKRHLERQKQGAA